MVAETSAMMLVESLIPGSSGFPGGHDQLQAPAGAPEFQRAYAKASERLSVAGPPAGTGIQSLLNPLLGLNERSARLAAEATPVKDRPMRPSELMTLTMRSHEFLFHCELVSNVANRTSDGVQQLFRQQT